MIVKKTRFIHKAIMMTAVSFLLRGLSTGFGIFLSNMLGAEGMGLYQLVASVYFLGITLSTSGITVAVTRIVSEELAVENYKGARDSLYKCLTVGVLLSLFALAGLFFGASWLGHVILKDERVIRPLMILAFSLPFISVGAIMRGYFMGAKQEKNAAGGDIAEQLLSIFLTVLILPFCIGKGLEAACCGLVLASTLSEALSCVYTFFLYIKDKRKSSGKNDNHIVSRIFEIAAPIAFSNYIRSALTSLENLLTPSGLSRYYANKSVGLSQYGMIKGMVMPVLFFPSAVLSAFSGMLVPEVSSANAINDKGRISFIINKCIKITLLFAFFIVGLFFCFHNEIALLLYKSKAIGSFILCLTPLIPFLYLDQVVDGILKGLNQQISTMKYNTADAIMRTVLVMLLVPLLGINGYILMFYIGTIFNATLSISRLIFVGKVKFQFKKWILLPMLATIIAFALVWLTATLPIFVRALIYTTAYIFLLILFACIKKNDFRFALRIFAK